MARAMLRMRQIAYSFNFTKFSRRPIKERYEELGTVMVIFF